MSHKALRISPRCLAGSTGLVGAAALAVATFATKPSRSAPAAPRLRGVAGENNMPTLASEPLDGNALPYLYGTAWKKEATVELVVRAVRAGFRGIDTACQPKHYREDLVGEALARLAAEDGVARDDLWVQTKFTPVSGQDPKNVPYDAAAPLAEQVAQSIAASKRNLRTDRIDSLVLHSPLRSHADTMTVWRRMEQAVAEGAVGQLGISNCYDLHRFERLYEAAAVKPRVLQNRFYEQSGYDRELRAFCLAHNVVYQTFWTLTANPKALRSRAVTAAARAHGVEPPQVLFQWLRQRGHQPLTGTKSAGHMAQDLAPLELTGAEMAAVGGLFD